MSTLIKKWLMSTGVSCGMLVISMVATFFILEIRKPDADDNPTIERFRED